MVTAMGDDQNPPCGWTCASVTVPLGTLSGHTAGLLIAWCKADESLLCLRFWTTARSSGTFTAKPVFELVSGAEPVSDPAGGGGGFGGGGGGFGGGGFGGGGGGFGGGGGGRGGGGGWRRGGAAWAVAAGAAR